jgi:hypothetical protein
MSKPRNHKPRFKVGDWVTYPRRPEPQRALIIEYRGPLGVGGEHYYRLRRVFDWGEVREFEQPESALEPAEAPAPK